MIPILYEKDEMSFNNNGLGRLRDCVTCIVTEERNGIYECDFEYPVDGAHFDEIQLGRIIGVEHDDTGDVQPFDIVSCTRPIDGVVSFHAVHVSYRQNYLTTAGENVTNLSQALLLCRYPAQETPFSYDTDKTSTGYFPLGDGLPHSVKSILGGTEGSILETYGGEYEWNVFKVILHGSRGEDKDFTIRYGVNMLDYNEELDSSETYMSVIPYWINESEKVVGNMQTFGTTITARSECIPLDVSDKFETKPTRAEVDAMGLKILQQRNPSVPMQNIHVEFVRLQDMGYEDFANLLTCRLCDTVKVEFPYYNATGRFKIVRTEWNVLKDRYESMELGDLRTTLSEALGIGSSVSGSGVNPALSFYPIGSVYTTVDANFDPNTEWGGTWQKEAEGVFYISAGTTYPLGSTGGSKDAIVPEHDHSVAITQPTFTIPNHKHGAYKYISESLGSGSVGARIYNPAGSNGTLMETTNSGGGGACTRTTNVAVTVNQTGVSVTDANLPPYKAVIRWLRTA